MTPRPRPVSLVPALAAFGVLTLSFDSIPLLAPPTVEGYGAALSSGAWLYVMTEAGFGLAAFWFGIRSIRRRRLLMLGMAGAAAANLAAAAAPGFPAHLAARTAVGFAMGALVAGAMGLVVDGGDAARRVGALTAVMPAASVLMPALGWITDAHGWRAAMVAVAAAAAAGLAVAYPKRGPDHVEPAPEGRPGRLFSRTALIGIVSGMIWAVGVMAPWVFVGAYAEVVLGGGAVLSGAALAVSGAAGFGASILAGRLSYAGRPFGLQASLAAGAASVLWVVRTGGVTSFLLSIAVWSWAHWFAFVVYQGLLAESVEMEGRRRILTFTALPLQVGYGLGAALASFVFHYWDFAGLGWVAAGLGAASMGAAWWAWGERLRLPTRT